MTGMGRVRIGTVWDRTTEMLSGRSAELLPIAALALVLPSVVQNALALYSPAGGAVQTGLVPIVGLVGFLLGLWGQLAIIALGSDPATTRAAAQRAGLTRLLPSIGITLLLVVLGILLFLPYVIVLAASGFDWSAAMAARSNPAAMPTIAPGALLFVSLYSIALVVFGLWIGARLVLTNAVVLHERRGANAIPRSVALTKGLTLRLIGVVLLFGIVFGIAVLAAQSVTGLIFRLILGTANIATALFLAGIVATIVSAIFLTMAYVFTAQLYVATSGRGDDVRLAQTFE